MHLHEPRGCGVWTMGRVASGGVQGLGLPSRSLSPRLAPRTWWGPGPRDLEGGSTAHLSSTEEPILEVTAVRVGAALGTGHVTVPGRP